MRNNIAFIKNLAPKKKPNEEDKLGFGKIMTDHMFVMDYKEGEGWINPCIVPYAPLHLEPCTMVFHYGQASFEGMKAYINEDNKINLFRPNLNFERMNKTHERMGMPPVDVDFCVTAVEELLKVEKEWIPTKMGTSMYIRPFVISTDAYLGVRSSFTFKFIIILSPSGNYYESGLNPVAIQIEDEYVRAVRGGTGFAKCPGNYAASILSQELAHDKGYNQVLWLDGVERKYIEEVGSMNFMFVRNNVLYTSALNGSILPGITRRSVLELVSSWGIEVKEERISVEDFISWAKAGEISEAFGTGTAAVIAPVGKLGFGSEEVEFNSGKIGELSQRLYKAITDMQYGRAKNNLAWVKTID